jgi:hypothetical protein
MPPGSVSPTLPPLPAQPGPVLPTRPASPPHVAEQQKDMALVDSSRAELDDQDRLAVIAVALVSGAGLLWLLTCLLVLRRRRAVNKHAHLSQP